HLLCLFRIYRVRLFAEYMLACLKRRDRDFGMVQVRRTNIDNIDIVASDQFLIVRVYCIDAQAFCNLLRPIRQYIAHGDDLGLWMLYPSRLMHSLENSAYANSPDAKLVTHTA